MPYFDETYFDETYFQTGTPQTGGHAPKGRVVLPPPIPDLEDDDLFVVRIL